MVKRIRRGLTSSMNGCLKSVPTVVHWGICHQPVRLNAKRNLAPPITIFVKKQAAKSDPVQPVQGTELAEPVAKLWVRTVALLLIRARKLSFIIHTVLLIRKEMTVSWRALIIAARQSMAHDQGGFVECSWT
ncbi:UNVERIFIED_CONTAM: hypothetical protein Sradi_7099500 [Sesamum radiatum]|uniref:Uncharacterized protein n=1 Tax=Sesamum radiatum TaxID=300843 RepID=A0AAW2J0X6_SESRA